MAEIVTDDELDLSEDERRRARSTLQPPIGRPMYGPPASAQMAAQPMARPVEPQPESSVGTPIAARPMQPPAAPQPIGTPISPDTVQMPQPTAVPLPTPNTVSGTGPLAPRPAAERLTALQEKGLPQYHGAKRFFDTLAGATNIGSAIEAASGLGTIGYKARTLAPAEAAAREEAKQIQEAATERETEARTGHEAGQEEQARAEAKLREAQAQKDLNPPRKLGRAVIENPQQPGEPLAADFDPVSGAYLNPDTGEAIAGAKPYEKPRTLSNPFEAFAYGTPQEKQAAQDFLSFEKRIGSQYEKPGEIEQRYALYQRDPEAYKAMFGDRGGAQDQANATRMLNYFDKRRKEISGDWALDETEKAKQLSEIDELQKPYMKAAGGNQDTDRVTVIHPNGTRGTIPRSQLKAAQKKGYKIPR